MVTDLTDTHCILMYKDTINVFHYVVDLVLWVGLDSINIKVIHDILYNTLLYINITCGLLLLLLLLYRMATCQLISCQKLENISTFFFKLFGKLLLLFSSYPLECSSTTMFI